MIVFKHSYIIITEINFGRQVTQQKPFSGGKRRQAAAPDSAQKVNQRL